MADNNIGGGEGIANHSSHLILYFYHILTHSNQSPHRWIRGNTLVEFEANRANGFLGNQISDRITDKKKDRDLSNYSMM